MRTDWLLPLLREHPSYEERDVIKTLFQALFGNGHLLGDEDAVTRRIADEMNAAGPCRDEPLWEDVGGWIRIGLRPARDLGISPAWIARMMLLPRIPATADRTALPDALAAASLPDRFDADRLAALARELVDDPERLPSHSEACRLAEAPSYRLVHAAWRPLLPVLRSVAAAERRPCLITVDGRCGSGKSTLAEALQAVLRCGLVHMDDFYTPHAQKTPERLAIPGGNCDIDRVTDEIVTPFTAGLPVALRRYDCQTREFVDFGTLPPEDMLILEGSYSELPPIREKAAVRVFLEIGPEDQLSRIRRRNAPESVRGFIERWIPLEEAYFSAYSLPDAGCVRVDAASLRLHEILSKGG